MVVAVIPAFNEASTIVEVVRATGAHVEHVIVVDDGSRDETGQLATGAGASVVSLSRNLGPGAATNAGIDEARALGATVVVTIDADGQHDPKDIPELLAPIESDQADVVFANRFGRPNSIPASRRAYNWCANVLTLLTAGLWVSDSQCGLKAFGPHALRDLQIRANGFEFCTEIVRLATLHGWRVSEVPSRVHYTASTMAKGQSLAVGFRTAVAAIRAAGR